MRWQYTERNLIWIKYCVGENLWLWSTVNIHTCAWPHIHLKALDWSAPEHNPCNEDHSANSCTSGVQTEMATKRRNSRPAALSVLTRVQNIHTCAWPHIHQSIRLIRPEHNPCNEDHSANSCTSGSNRDGDKEEKLTACSFKCLNQSTLKTAGYIRDNWVHFKKCI